MPDMTWPKWLLIGWYLITLPILIASIGKPRQPFTPANAAALVIVVSVIIVLVVIA